MAEVVFVAHDADLDGHVQLMYRCRPRGHLLVVGAGEDVDRAHRLASVDVHRPAGS